jgi:hypothetical protein
MRLVLHGDVTSVARVLMSVTADRWIFLCSSILSQAHSADCYRKRFKRPYPDWGNGSLMAMGRSIGLQTELELTDLEYCDCLERVFSGLRHWRLSQSNRTRNSGKAAPMD